MKKIKIAVSLIILLIGVAFAEEKADDKLVAVGDGFKISQKHLKSIMEFSEKEDFGSTDQEHKNAIVRLFCFAYEAKQLGLDKNPDAKKIEEEPIGRLFVLQKLYMDMVIETYPVSDLAIESYYWAHPQYFDAKKDDPINVELVPLTPELKKKIKMKIAEGKRAEMTFRMSDELKQKYHVVFCDTEGVCK